MTTPPDGPHPALATDRSAPVAAGDRAQLVEWLHRVSRDSGVLPCPTCEEWADAICAHREPPVHPDAGVAWPSPTDEAAVEALAKVYAASMGDGHWRHDMDWARAILAALHAPAEGDE